MALADTKMEVVEPPAVDPLTEHGLVHPQGLGLHLQDAPSFASAVAQAVLNGGCLISTVSCCLRRLPTDERVAAKFEFPPLTVRFRALFPVQAGGFQCQSQCENHTEGSVLSPDECNKLMYALDLGDGRKIKLVYSVPKGQCVGLF